MQPVREGPCRATPSCSPRRSQRSASLTLASWRHASQASDPPLVIDVREPDERAQGAIPGALGHPAWLPRVARVERNVPDREDSGRRLLRAARARCSRRRRSASSDTRTSGRWPAGSRGWKSRGLPVDRAAPAATPDQASATRRHADPRGRRGRPAEAARSRRCCARRGRPRLAVELYLAAAGVGTLGIVDEDVVDASNLQRQMLHTTDRIGEPKVDRRETRSRRSTPTSRSSSTRSASSSENVVEIIDGLRRHRRRHRQLPHALPGQRRERSSTGTRSCTRRSSASRAS